MSPKSKKKNLSLSLSRSLSRSKIIISGLWPAGLGGRRRRSGPRHPDLKRPALVRPQALRLSSSGGAFFSSAAFFFSAAALAAAARARAAARRRPRRRGRERALVGRRGGCARGDSGRRSWRRV